ncbi:integral membrane [Cordyceps militaris]|uniref:Integral membrane n=1 Tax=Cordyceps militaris TaxID=73501 RepID=A0A2H4SAP4_CORMI|nr:integral membrane [Cordyceps militaris]
MASGMFFDPIVALRALPLVSSTCTLLFGWDQTFFLSLLNRPENRGTSKHLLPAYFRRMFRFGLPLVVSLIAISFWSGLAGARRVRQARPWYAAGAAAALGHLLFVPLVAPPVRQIIEADADTDVNERLDYWVRVNTVRTFTVDLAAWIAFVVAVGKTLQ